MALSSEKLVRLRSSDSQILMVKESIALQCGKIIKNMVDDGYADGEIPLPNVDSKTLSRVIEWCQKHAEVEFEEDERKRWESKFMEVDTDDLYDLIMASNYLDVKDLLNACCDKTAELLKGKTPDQIRKTLGITNDFTPEEQEQIEKQYGWALH